MNKGKAALLAAVGIGVLAMVLSIIGPRRAMAALGYTPVRDVDAPARQAYKYGYYEAIPAGGIGVGHSVQVPPGKELVIETVSGTMFGGGEDGVYYQVITHSGSNFVVYTFVPTETSPTSGIRACTQPVTIYADPGTTVNLQSYVTGGAFGGLSISGHYVDVP